MGKDFQGIPRVQQPTLRGNLLLLTLHMQIPVNVRFVVKSDGRFA